MKTKINKDLLYKLYEIHSPSGGERKMKRFIKSYIRTNIENCAISCDNAGNMYITRGEAENYPCVVAHLDQVQHIHSNDFTVMECGDIVFGYSPSRKQTEGLGADDKNGIFIALECLKMFDKIKVAFFVKEEIGCVGSNAANMDFFQNCKYVIEPDRRGNNDLITEASFTELCSEKFVGDVIGFSDYNTTTGLCTDVMELKENGLTVSAINLSCGYYNPHTDYESTNLKDLQKCLTFVQLIISNVCDVYPHEHVEYKFDYGYSKETCNYNYFEDYEIAYQEIEELSKYIDVRDLTPKQIAEFVGFKIDKYAVENAYDDFLAFNNPNNSDKLTEI